MFKRRFGRRAVKPCSVLESEKDQRMITKTVHRTGRIELPCNFGDVNTRVGEFTRGVASTEGKVLNVSIS